jgi:hypothetical protein
MTAQSKARRDAQHRNGKEEIFRQPSPRKPGDAAAKQLNAVEIEEAISQLADQPFEAENFPYAFLEAFGNKETTIKRLRTGPRQRRDTAARRSS